MLVSGFLRLTGTVAYAPQAPWIISGTLRDNVTVGRPMDDALFAAALTAACLDADVTALPEGYNTDIGERGAGRGGYFWWAAVPKGTTTAPPSLHHRRRGRVDGAFKLYTGLASGGSL